MKAGWFERPGLILFTAQYEACVAFYRDVLILPVEESQDDLVRFSFGSGYLMVERGGVGAAAEKSRAQSPITLRFNVADFDATADALRGRGIALEVRHWAWGTTGHFSDPDGNRCEIRDRFRP